ncbi:MAG: segregation/condensation protein A [Tepidisphaeraceae bacterium]|jgi:segregation and condensation protein A
MEYRVELDVYSGPLDLLLFLIKRDELDICDIPIARITDSYMSYIQELRNMSREHGLDINVAGEFLVMAATLMEIKSAMLLPRQPAEGDGTQTTQDLTDPRYELVQQLLEYKRFKDAASALDHRQTEHQQRFARYPARRDASDDDAPPIDLEEIQIYDLLDAFKTLMAEVGARKPRFHEVVYDDTPIDLHAADIEDRLRRDGRLSFRQLLEGRQSRSEMIGVFLALLELIRQRKILVTQADDPSDLQIDAAPEGHRNPPADTPMRLVGNEPSEGQPTAPIDPAEQYSGPSSPARRRRRRKPESEQPSPTADTTAPEQTSDDAETAEADEPVDDAESQNQENA